ncbi:hypothetical protein FANTH_11964 [Fusarium anthophilum]|uniref:Ankyrin repeat protein n=1 Tax=Fusarium anthophilum TaxID=48485 RepID=A0A8H4YVE8_9HYPO|nr:hypothetical protein FANTH_11964 [Fusarium anthophilum]
MSLSSKARLFSALLLLLELLVYLEDLLYEVLWFRWQPSSTTVLDKLFLSKEDEIWHAAIYGDDGDMRKILEDLTNFTASSNVSGNGGLTFSPADHGVDSSPGKMEAGALFNRHRTKLQEAIATDVTKSWAINDEERESTVKARLESIADQLANSSRRLTVKEIMRLQDWTNSTSSAVSILWTAIDRGHKSDVDYLLRQRNQKLYMENGDWQRTVLHKAVSNLDAKVTRDILEGGSSTSPQAYINAEDSTHRTALHILIGVCFFGRTLTNNQDLGNALKIFDLLYRHGANINALNGRFRTPLHLVLMEALFQQGTDLESIIPIFHRLLEAGAEMSTKDILGNSPLHTACELQAQDVIEVLVRNGADLETLNHDGKTPRRVFLDHRGPEEFWKRMVVLFRKVQRTGPEPISTSGRVLQRREQISKARMTVCQKSVVYCRYQQNNVAAESSNPFYWTATDKFVSDVLYPTNRPENVTFFAQCEKECQAVWDDLVESPSGLDQEEQEREQESTVAKAAEENTIPLAKDIWKWVNFSANNITWVRIMSQDASKSSKNKHGESTKAKPMVSLAIPFLDIEAEDYDSSTTMQGEEAYSPFTVLDGLQMPQTLDQTSINAESVSKLRCKENQVIYRWSQKQYSTQSRRDPLEWRVRNPFSTLASLLRKVRKHTERYDNREAVGPPFGRTVRASGGERAGDSTGIPGILKDRRPKWLMVRQLWLWKLNDGDCFPFSYFDPYTDEPSLKDTILTAIPSRRSMCMADDLLETIKRSSLHEISDVDDLMKHIVQETIKFPARFRRAGLGEHILDIFESEIASEADEEATFYNNFAENEWDSKQANRAISCTWRVKDIRDELGLIRNVFTSQLKVVKQFSKVLAPHQPKTSADSEYIRTLVSELESIIARIGVMDSEAAKTTDSLSNITQAMLAQAALKEAEAARFMNFIILPFTIVTVIFTPLSFMTSLFAVNSDGFPHNEDGELRIPSDWFWRRMVIGEFGTLVPLFIFIMFLYHSQGGLRNRENNQ